MSTDTIEQEESIVHFSKGAGALYVSSAVKQSGSGKIQDDMPGTGGDKFAKVVAASDDVTGEIAMWGSNNQLPRDMMRDIEKTGVLVAGIGAKARIANGKGPIPAQITGLNEDGYEQLKFILDSDINDWMELNNSFLNSYKVMNDLFGLGNAWVQILTSPDRKEIWGYKHVDAVKCRFEKMNEKSRRIEHVFISSDWDRYTDGNAEDKFFKKVPLLDRDFPMYDLQNRKSGNVFMMSIQYPLSGRDYYAPSPWYSAMEWVKIAQRVPKFKAAYLENSMDIKFLVEVHPDFWQQYDSKYPSAGYDGQKAIREKFFADVDAYLVGGENAGKSIWSPMVSDLKTQKVESLFKITPIEDKQKDGKMLADSGASNIEILLPLMINAALLGVDMPGGDAYGSTGSGSDIREAFLVQVMLLELERQLNNGPLDLAKRMNGWSKKYPNLVFRYPNQILTVLSDGKNTQATA